MERAKLFAVLAIVEIILGFFICSGFHQAETAAVQAKANDYSAPLIEDFSINTTWANQTCQWAFKVSDNSGLSQAVFGCNNTGTFTNETSSSLSGMVQWLNYTRPLYPSACVVSFQLWVWDIDGNHNTTASRYMRVYEYNDSVGAWNTPYISLSNAISNVESNNNWTSVETYAKVLLDQAPRSSLESMIDNYSNAVASQERYIYCGSGSGEWTNPEKAYDNNTNTAASCSGVANWSPFLVINLTSRVRGTTIQYLADRNSTSVTYMDIDIANATGSWTKVMDAIPAYGFYQNITFAYSEYTAMRFKFKFGVPSTAFLNETQAVNGLVYDWRSVLKWSAICQKLNITRKSAIVNALGNATMVGNLPYTENNPYDLVSTFNVQDKWALYGYYYAVLFNTSLAKWNTTKAFNQFNASVYYSKTHTAASGPAGLPLWIFENYTGATYTNRYYDEGACVIEDYILFEKLLNVTGGLDEALNCWDYLNANHWIEAGQYFQYVPNDIKPSFECESPFFLEIISTLKYYSPNMGNWSRVLIDIGTRYLANGWNSSQWLTSKSNLTNYAVVHKYVGNNETRLRNTIAAWQVLLGVFTGLNATCRKNMLEMLQGTSEIEPAWALLFRPEAKLYDAASKQFKWSGNEAQTNNNGTAYAEFLLFLQGIVPDNTAVAFPLEELSYEYLQSANPENLRFNSATQTITIPVSSAGDITFQYGTSPSTCRFDQGGIWQITFSNSWNMIIQMRRLAALPANQIYFTQIPASQQEPCAYQGQATVNGMPAPDGAIITAVIRGTTLAWTTVAMNGTYGSPTEGSTPFEIPSDNPNTTDKDGGVRGDTIVFYVDGIIADQTAIFEPGTLFGVDLFVSGTPPPDFAVAEVTTSKNIVGQGYTDSIDVTVENQGSMWTLPFNLSIYANSTTVYSEPITLVFGSNIFHLSLNTDSSWSYGNYTLQAAVETVPNETNTANNNLTYGISIHVGVPGDVSSSTPGVYDGVTNMKDIAYMVALFNTRPSSSNWNANADVDNDAVCNMRDIAIAVAYFNQHE